MEKDKVSIIIPFYKKHNSIEKTLKSALNQTYKNIEIIIVFDGDPQKIEEEKIEDERIKTSYLKNNMGPAVARNYGASKATGKYLSFLDADDVWYPNKLEDEINILENSKKSAVFSRLEFIYRDKKRKTLPIKNIKLVKFFIYNYAFCGSNLTIRKDIFDEYKYNERLYSFKLHTEDYDLILRLIKDNLLTYNKKVSLFYDYPTEKIIRYAKGINDYTKENTAFLNKKQAEIFNIISLLNYYFSKREVTLNLIKITIRHPIITINKIIFIFYKNIIRILNI